MRVGFLALIAAIFAVGCASNRVGGDSAANLEGTKWQVTAIAGKAVRGLDADSFTLSFSDDKDMGGKAMCNSIIGHYEGTSLGRLSIEVVGLTMMYCPNIEMEDKFVKALESVTRYKVDGDYLTLYNDREEAIILTTKK